MKKYVIVGAGGRGLTMFAKPMASELAGHAELAGVYDTNRLRAAHLSRECGNIPVYDSFDGMIAEVKPDAVIVTTIDRYHHEYIIKALQAGCDVISEKPMTIDAEKANMIIEAERRTGHKVYVTFNCRFMPYVARIKELLQAGAVGDILNVDFEWFLDTRHGADYFRRWHRYLENSGGLLVHKSTHHFDMANWWIGEEPEEIYAFGARRFYGPTRKARGKRCLTCGYKNTCEFYFDITEPGMARDLYYECEEGDGYIRDQCIFDESINIYDTMSVTVKYAKGALMAYSLNAYSPYEGWRVAITGTGGRLEAEDIHSGPGAEGKMQKIKVYDQKGETVEYNVLKAAGGHGGGDVRLRRMLFVGDISDPLGQQADSRAGAMSLLIGAAANTSIEKNQPVRISEVFPY